MTGIRETGKSKNAQVSEEACRYVVSKSFPDVGERKKNQKKNQKKEPG